MSKPIQAVGVKEITRTTVQEIRRMHKLWGWGFSIDDIAVEVGRSPAEVWRRCCHIKREKPKPTGRPPAIKDERMAALMRAAGHSYEKIGRTLGGGRWAAKAAVQRYQNRLEAAE